MDIITNIEILLIEDNPAEMRLIAEIFSEDDSKVNINGVGDGIAAMDYLYRKGKYKYSKTPSLIILDLNLPKKNGHEVLEEIKTDDKLKCIPVVVLTSSNSDNDILESYKHHANAYMTKPVDFNKFKEYIHAFKNYWFNSAVLPRN